MKVVWWFFMLKGTRRKHVPCLPEQNQYWQELRHYFFVRIFIFCLIMLFCTQSDVWKIMNEFILKSSLTKKKMRFKTFFVLTSILIAFNFFRSFNWQQCGHQLIVGKSSISSGRGRPRKIPRLVRSALAKIEAAATQTTQPRQCGASLRRPCEKTPRMELQVIWWPLRRTFKNNNFHPFLLVNSWDWWKSFKS